MKIAAQVFVFFISYFSLINSALAAVCPNSTPNTAVFYVNGMDTDYNYALFSKAVLKKEFTQAKPNEAACLTFYNAYNKTPGPLMDFYQSAQQKLNEKPSGIWRFLAIGPFFAFVGPEELRELYQEKVGSIGLDSYLKDPTLKDHLNDYRKQLFDKGNKVVAVAHSQGNFYANKAFEYLHDPPDSLDPLVTRSFGVVAVATPSYFVPDNGLWTTLTTDLLIGTVRLFLFFQIHCVRTKQMTRLVEISLAMLHR